MKQTGVTRRFGSKGKKERFEKPKDGFDILILTMGFLSHCVEYFRCRASLETIAIVVLLMRRSFPIV